jgi:hypothetical protein
MNLSEGVHAMLEAACNCIVCLVSDAEMAQQIGDCNTELMFSFALRNTNTRYMHSDRSSVLRIFAGTLNSILRVLCNGKDICLCV